MTDSVEAQGKTVKEAVSEALLKMGARENEVKVTVLEQPKSGLFGFLGGKPAKVLIEKKAPRGRGGRKPERNDNHGGHGFGVSAEGDNRKGGNSRRSQGGSSSQRRRGGRGKGSAQVSPANSDARGNRDTERKQTQQTQQKQAAPKQVASKQTGPKQEKRGSKNSRNTHQAKSNVRNENRSGRNMNRNRYKHTDGEMVLDKNNPHLDEQRKHFEAAERARKNENPARAKRENRSEAPSEDRGGKRNEQRGRGRDNRSYGRNDNRKRNQDNRGNRNNRNSQNSNAPSPEFSQTPQVPDEIIVQGLNASKNAPVFRDVPLEESNATLEKVAVELFSRAGFPCRCDVVDDEYSLVRIVTDDASAGMLIGRHGSTVDAIEHLVERMTCNAVGERVRMNLDINNYRRRREESLVERVADAVQSVLSSGRPYHIEPQDARERRMVHMEALKTEGLRTYTMYGSGGKHVVIAIDDSAKDKEVTEPETPLEKASAGTTEESQNMEESKSEVLETVDNKEENPEA